MVQSNQLIDVRYSRALGIATLQVVAVLLLAALTLDGGAALRQTLCSILAYLVAAAVVITRRPFNATAGDLLAIKFGFLILVAAMLLINVIDPRIYEWFAFRSHR
jgi:hypothetical protein